MALDVYFVSDIRQGLVATVTITIRVYVANGGRNTEHARGILDHAAATATLYGIPWPDVVATVRCDLGAGYAGLLDRAMAGLLEAGR